VVERKKANEVYDEFGRIAGLRLELNYRERRAAHYYKSFRDTGLLGGFVSCSDVSTLGVRKKREQRISLRTSSATIVLEEDSKQKGQVHEDSRVQAYIIVMMFMVALKQEIPVDAYPGLPNAGYEEVPGVGRRRLGLTFGMRETFVRAISFIGGTPSAYLARVDTIMSRIVDAIDDGRQHPVEIIRDYVHKYEGEFQLAMPSGSAPTPKDDKDKGGTSRPEPQRARRWVVSWLGRCWQVWCTRWPK
jgi:hypothetical protein